MTLKEYIETNKLIIIRGIPGSGKSTLASKIIKKLPNSIILEIDDYFYDENGKYNYDVSKLGKACLSCKERAEKYLKEGKNVIVSNTFTMRREINRYIKIANELNISYVIIRMNTQFKNIHDVSEEKIKIMKERMVNINGEITPQEFLKTL
jgi:predicted kinase